jgi:hypothetical protein
MHALSSVSVASSKHGAKRHLEPALKMSSNEAELDLGLKLKKNTETMPAPEVEPKTKPTERAVAVDSLPLAQSPAELSPPTAALAYPVPNQAPTRGGRGIT